MAECDSRVFEREPLLRAHAASDNRVPRALAVRILDRFGTVATKGSRAERHEYH